MVVSCVSISIFYPLSSGFFEPHRFFLLENQGEFLLEFTFEPLKEFIVPFDLLFTLDALNSSQKFSLTLSDTSKDISLPPSIVYIF
jgi:hypothetical protein